MVSQDLLRDQFRHDPIQKYQKNSWFSIKREEQQGNIIILRDWLTTQETPCKFSIQSKYTVRKYHYFTGLAHNTGKHTQISLHSKFT